jgi:hypothetical protein
VSSQSGSQWFDAAKLLRLAVDKTTPRGVLYAIAEGDVATRNTVADLGEYLNGDSG